MVSVSVCGTGLFDDVFTVAVVLIMFFLSISGTLAWQTVARSFSVSAQREGFSKYCTAHSLVNLI